MTRLRKRTAHWLRPNHDTSIPSNFVFLDCQPAVFKEKDNEKQEIHRLGVCSAFATRLEPKGPTKAEDLVTASPYDFFCWLTKKITPQRPAWIVCYGCTYTLSLLDFWQSLTERLFTFSPVRYHDADGIQHSTEPGFMFAKEPVVVLGCRSDIGSVYCCDIRNWFRGTFAELAASLGRDVPAKPGEAAEYQDWADYARNRATIVKEAFLELAQWWRANKLGDFGFTASSLAWHAYRHRWMPTTWKKGRKVGTLLVHDNADALSLERAAMAGGETRVFFCGDVRPVLTAQDGRLWRSKIDQDSRSEGPVHCLDMNALYPSVMRDNVYPIELVMYHPAPTLEDIKEWQKYLCVIAKVQLETHDATYPWRQRSQEGPENDARRVRDPETYWAIGRYATVLCGPELARAIERQHVKAVHGVAIYRWGKPFRTWVEDWHRMRLEWKRDGKPLWASFAKLLMNSLPGKFGQRLQTWQDDPTFACPAPWGYFHYSSRGEKMAKCMRSFGWLAQREADPAEAPESMPAVSAFVYSYARHRMAELRAIVGIENLYYQDTDSLHVTAEGRKNLERAGECDAEALGKLRFERIVATARYRGPKDYTQDGENTIAGLKDEAVQIRPDTYEQPVYEGIDGLIDRLGKAKDHAAHGEAKVHSELFRIGKLHVRGRTTKDGAVLPPIVWDNELMSDEAVPPWTQELRRKAKDK